MAALPRAHLDSVDPFHARKPNGIAVDLSGTLTNDTVNRISPEFERSSLFGVVLVVIVDAVGNTAFAAAAVVQDAFAHVLRDAKAAHVGAGCAP